MSRGALHTMIELLLWSQLNFKKTINIDPKRGNVATIWTEGGSNKYKHLCKLLKDTTVMYDALVDHQQKSKLPSTDDEIYTHSSNWDGIHAVNHEGDDVLTISGIDNIEVAGTSSATLLEWHMRFGHMPFPRLQLLAKEGFLPKRLAQCQIPICASCMYGKL
jgi:GAG-pre-integrase domain